MDPGYFEENGNNKNNEMSKDSNKSNLSKKKTDVFDRTNFLKALKYDKVFRTNFICIVTCYVASAFIFDLFIFTMPNLKGNIYMNAIMVGIFESVAFGMSGVLIEILGLKY